MTPNPILRVLSTFQIHRVKALLIGGQACILYGAAEFSRDSDFVVFVSAENLRRLRRALAELQAEPIYVPPLRAKHLRRGHACHFRCGAEGVERLRVDVMSKLRGCDDFDSLWRRRMVTAVPGGPTIPAIGLRDLVRSKKTQRDKDWFMLKRLVNNDVLRHGGRPELEQVHWWLLECHAPETLVDLAKRFPRLARMVAAVRPLLRHALSGDTRSLANSLAEEEGLERERDREYWRPLRKELERMRHVRRGSTE